jgi:hypothetical protein
MRRATQLVKAIRRQSENEQIDPDDGIGDDEVLQYLNDGQERLEAAIIRTHEKAFAADSLIDLVRDQEIYTLPFGTFINHNLIAVEYSFTGTVSDYIPLRRGKHIERTSFRGFPSFYIPRVREILINPISDRSVTSGIRITYNPKHPRMDKRRGIVTAVTLAGSAVTNLVVDATSGEVSYDPSDFEEFDRISVVDVDGTQKMKNIPLDNADSNGTLTVRSSFAFQTGETIAVGDYVVLGENATTHLQMPQICEKYLIEYGVWKMMIRDSSSDVGQHAQLVAVVEQDIVDAFAEISGDVDRVPIINADNVW